MVVEYSSGMVVVTDDASSQVITLTVAGTTEEDDFIALERVHLIVQPLADAVQIGEMLIVSNYGDATYVGSPLPDGTMATIRIGLPPDAAQVAFESGELGDRFVEIAGGVADTQGVAPGRSVDQIVLSYNLPPQRDAWTLEYEFPYPVNALNVPTTELRSLAGPAFTARVIRDGNASACPKATTTVPAKRPAGTFQSPIVSRPAAMSASAARDVRFGPSRSGTWRARIRVATTTTENTRKTEPAPSRPSCRA